MTKTTWLIVTGSHTSTKTALDYVEHIVYGVPRIEAVTVGSHFVAILEYGPEQSTAADYTRERMHSFPHGVSRKYDLDSALAEFGEWVRHYAPVTGFKPDRPASLERRLTS